MGFIQTQKWSGGVQIPVGFDTGNLRVGFSHTVPEPAEPVPATGRYPYCTVRRHSCSHFVIYTSCRYRLSCDFCNNLCGIC